MKINHLIIVLLLLIAPCFAETTNDTPEQVLNFWFSNLQSPEDYPEKQSKMWFNGGPEVDQEISDRFGHLLDKVKNNELAEWKETPRGRLALILLVDQFPRNLYRGTSKAFDFDAIALQLTLEGLQLGEDLELYPIERVFFYLPLEHSEDLSIQELSLEKFFQLANDAPPSLQETLYSYAEYATSHYDIIARFGRFPHRNAILERSSTEEEIEFLQGPRSSF